MGAISGIINTNTDLENRDDYCKKITSTLAPYKIDNILTNETSNAFFVYANQVFTKEDNYNIGAYYHKETNNFMIADCMIDNRDSLFLKIDPSYLHNKPKDQVSDQELLYAAYLSLGTKFTDYVCGIFSFVIYNDKKKECLIFTDHTSTRTIHYMIDNGIIYFATLFETIKKCVNKPLELNEEWLSFADALPNPDLIYRVEQSPYIGIYTVEAGHYISIKDNEVKAHCYYNPSKVKLHLNLKTDEEYKNYFINLLDTCTTSLLRSNKNTGCTLSSGLDSSAVACLAARALEKRGETLHSYTSVPLKDFNAATLNTKGVYEIEDESFGPIAIKEKYKNLSINLVDCKGKTAFTAMRNTIKLNELPHKSLVNYTWMSEIYDLASKNDCKIMLKGQYGNSTISNGKILSRVYQELLSFKFISAIKQSKEFIRVNKIPKKLFIKNFINSYKAKFKLDLSELDKFYLRKDLIDKYHIRKELKKNFTKEGGTYIDSKAQFRRYVYDTRILQHLGLFDTRLSLIYGVVIRDPAKDKRMIDFVFNAPNSCMVHNGVERRMIREYMKGIIPDEILNVTNRRGRQSSDYAYRVNNAFNLGIKKEILTALDNKKLYDYLDASKIELLKKRIENSNKLDEDEIQNILCICSLSVFLQIHYGNC